MRGMLVLIAPAVVDGVASGAPPTTKTGSSQVFVNCETFPTQPNKASQIPRQLPNRGLTSMVRNNVPGQHNH
jgi:hypothetical protein